MSCTLHSRYLQYNGFTRIIGTRIHSHGLNELQEEGVEGEGGKSQKCVFRGIKYNFTL